MVICADLNFRFQYSFVTANILSILYIMGAFDKLAEFRLIMGSERMPV